MSIIIVGAGEIGYHVARRLSLEKKDVTIIDIDPEKIKKIQDSLDVQTVHASGSSLAALQKAGINDADMLVAVTSSDETNIVSCLVANAQTKIPTTIARVRSLDYIYNPHILAGKNFSIDVSINPDYEAVASLMQLFSVPGATDVVDFSDGRVKLIGCRVQNPVFYDGIRLQDLSAKSSIRHVVVVAVYRDGDVIIPQGNDTICHHDSVYAITSDDDIQRLTAFFGQGNTAVTRNAMIVGGGTVGLLLAKEFERLKIATKLIEANESRCMQIADELNKTVVLHYGGDIEEIISEEYVDNTDLFIAVTDDEEENILLSLLAKQKGAKKVIALIQNMTYTQLVSKIGIDLVINPNLCAINRILHYIRKGKVLSVASFYDKNAEAIEAVALETSDIVNRPLRSIKFPKDAVIGAIIRGSELIVPNGNSIILPGDRVVIFALSTAVGRVEKMLTVKLEYW
jgi:trk system potassium uptake protein TrkA